MNEQYRIFIEKLSKYATTDEMGDGYTGSGAAFDEIILEARELMKTKTQQGGQTNAR